MWHWPLFNSLSMPRPIHQFFIKNLHHTMSYNLNAYDTQSPCNMHMRHIAAW